ncbi:peptidoglycan-binding domain-containing protein [Sulfobacillus harzensis]|uniref:Peptidoglycan-binding protein n=1 Tax=Sulfobacillus harzensis TaxID=2729629 RepID=A0A7Y0L6Y7_9FIRM|nr:peptidoglycan-binding domain-containing protein [Sulfobacillus harzensis]NMP24432.1 peptidoglycan-binding protein [Sulfobacillus harzensis]
MSDALTCTTVTLTHPYTQSENVKAIQMALKSHGYDIGPIDGIFGPVTASGVEAFKMYEGIKPVNPTVDLPIYYKLGVRCVSTRELTEQLDYNNPLLQKLETAWVDGKKYWAYGPNIPLPIDPKRTKVAQEYVIVYHVSRRHHWATFVPLQLNIYDSIPGDPKYSPIWHLNWVVVPHSYVPNTLKSVHDVKRSPYKVIPSDVYVN